MGLNRFKPMPSGRMGIFWTLAGISEVAVVEFGCMGHNIYSGGALRREGIYEGKGASLYTTYIDETDIAMGDTARLAATIAQVVATEHPKAIFLQPSAVPEVVGTDLTATAMVLQEDFPDTPLIPVGRGSFAISQHRGVQEALLSLVKALPKDVERSEVPCYNVIGSCPDLFNYAADCIELQRMMKGAFNMEKLCLLSSACSVTEIENMGAAHVNLVFRREGIPAAEHLKKRFGTPYVYARPYGIKGSSRWLETVGEALGMPPSAEFIAAEEKLALMQTDRACENLRGHQWSYPEEAILTIGGHADVVKGIVAFAEAEAYLTKNAAWCDCPEHAEEGLPYFSEREWAPVIENHGKGYVMFSGEALLWAGRNTALQISKPDIGWHIHPYDPPFVGYHGAVNLINLWMNERVLQG